MSAGLNGRDNALGLLRLVLAAAVIFSHAFPLGGWGEDPMLSWTRGQENLGGIAVLGFFSISGYLIAKSGTRGDIVTFLWHRVLRIMPAFYTVLLVGAGIVGPLFWIVEGRSLTTYFTADPFGPLGYLVHNARLAMGQYGIYDVFVDTPYGVTAGSVLNGSLWTLEHEFFCYLVIAGLVLITVMARPRVARVVVPLITAVMLAIQVGRVFFDVNFGAVVPLLGNPLRTHLLFAFLLGSCIAVFSRRVPVDDRIAVAAGVVLLVSLGVGGAPVFGLPAIAYLCLFAAARLPSAIHWIGAKNDYSYGVYVYGFLVQQCLAFAGVYRWGYVPFVALSVLITAGCAWLSWHGVEKRALALKDRGPGRGIRYWYDRMCHRGAPAEETT
jgi:peptidoglycan/LPS O-acetylase OafA/YrhL